MPDAHQNVGSREQRKVHGRATQGDGEGGGEGLCPTNLNSLKRFSKAFLKAR